MSEKLDVRLWPSPKVSSRPQPVSINGRVEHIPVYPALPKPISVDVIVHLIEADFDVEVPDDYEVDEEENESGD